MKYFSYLALVGAISLSATKPIKMDDFSEIKIKEGLHSNSTSTEENSVVMPLYRSKTYKDHVKD